MNIVILGAGAMGSLFGGLLAEAGHEVALVDLDADHIAAVNREGLRLQTEGADRRVRLRAGFARDMRGPAELLIVFTKTLHTRDALASAAHLVGADTWALTLQNGLGNAEKLAMALPPERIALGMTSFPADLKGPGHVSSHGGGETRLWGMAGTSGEELPARERERVEAIAHALDGAGLDCRTDPEIRVPIWEKAIFNAAMNTLCAITRLPVGVVGDHPDGRAVAFAVVNEAIAVAHALGIRAERLRIEAALAHAFASHREHKPSMLQDLLAGRLTEIDSINGAICEEARRAGLAAPVTETLLRLVRVAQAPWPPKG